MKKIALITSTIILLLLGIYILFIKLLLPIILNQATSAITNESVNKTLQSVKNIDYSGAKVQDISFDVKKHLPLQINLNLNKGTLNLSSNVNKNNVSGNIKYLGQEPYIDHIPKTNILTIQSQDQEGEEQNIKLPTNNLNIANVGAGVGILNIDLTDLNMPQLSVAAGAGEVSVIFSKKYSITASLAAGSGMLNINIPNDNGIKIMPQPGNSINIDFGPGFDKVADGYQSKNYNKASVKTNISIGQASGGLNINPIK